MSIAVVAEGEADCRLVVQLARCFAGLQSGDFERRPAKGRANISTTAETAMRLNSVTAGIVLYDLDEDPLPSVDENKVGMVWRLNVVRERSVANAKRLVIGFCAPAIEAWILVGLYGYNISEQAYRSGGLSSSAVRNELKSKLYQTDRPDQARVRNKHPEFCKALEREETVARLEMAFPEGFAAFIAGLRTLAGPEPAG